MSRSDVEAHIYAGIPNPLNKSTHILRSNVSRHNSSGTFQVNPPHCEKGYSFLRVEVRIWLGKWEPFTDCYIS